MIRLPQVALPLNTAAELQTLQSSVDILRAYSDRVEAAKTLFKRRNTAKNPTFAEVRKSLTRMCAGARRCVYCEDSCADEVEHIKPKDLYPESVFHWNNYVYACGPCNGPKNNQFAVFSAGTGLVTDITRPRLGPVLEPEPGSPVLIDPRWEDPLQFMALDLIDTHLLLPTKAKGSKDRVRAEYTIEVLKLNRDVLLKARREAHGHYEARLSQYIAVRDRGDSAAQLRHLIRALKRMQHPTVWKEMKRQHVAIPMLAQIIGSVKDFV